MYLGYHEKFLTIRWGFFHGMVTAFQYGYCICYDVDMKKEARRERNWALVVIASTVILLNAILLLFVSFNTVTLGWWSLVIAAGALSSIWFSVMAIRKNEAAWLLLDLILPN